MDRINVTKPSMPPYEEYIEEIKDIWETHHLTNMGNKHKELEEALCKYFEMPNVTLYTNGHLALEAMISAFELKGEIITTPFTFISTVNAIVRSGSKPVYCDINQTDYTIDVSKIQSLITPRTVAILPVHVYGHVCDDKSLATLAKENGLKLIYDAAHAFGVKINGKSVAGLGDASMFSFHATKVFNTIEGGAVAYRDKSLKSKLEANRNFGMSEDGSIICAGGNSKMNEFQAAMGLCNLRYLDREIDKRKRVALIYQEHLGEVKGIKLCQKQKNVEENYSYFPVVFDGYKYDRDQIYNRLIEHNIYARKYFGMLANDNEYYGHHWQETPVAKRIADNILALPMYADLDPAEARRICEVILRLKYGE